MTAPIRFVLAVAAVVLSLPSLASAQLGGPGVDLPAVDAERALRSVAGPQARFDREGDRIRIARGMRVRVPGEGAVDRAERFLEHYGAAFGAGPSVDLRVDEVLRGHGFTVVRLRRHAFGLPVMLRSVMVRVLPSGEIDLVNAATGSARQDATAPTVSTEDVAADAPTRVRQWPSARAVEVREVALDLGDRVARGFAVDVEGDARHERGLLVYDGGGQLLVGVPRVLHALGRVYENNPVVAEEITSDVELQHLTSRERLTGRYVRITSCGAEGSRCDPQQRAMADADGNFLYDPEEPVFDDEFAEVNAYHHADAAASYFREVHDFEWSCCGGTTVMEVLVNYSESPGTPYDNAAYSPSSCSRDQCGGIFLGQGSGKDFAYDGDVIYHEFTHSVVDETAGIVGFDLDDLGVSYEPLGINEGTADYFAGTVAGDPRIAEYFAGTGGFGGMGSLREIDGDTRCPESLFGEGHLDGRVWSGVLWEIRESLGAEKADALAYSTLLTMTDNTVFDAAAELLLASTDALISTGVMAAGDVAAVEAAITGRGLSGCRRIVPLDDQVSHDGYSGSDFATGSVGGSVVPLHYSLDVPADATKVTLHMGSLTPGSGDYTYYLRNGEPLRFVASRRPPLLFDTEVDAEAVVELTDDTEHPLPRCDTLYLAIIADDLNTAGESAYRIRASIETSGDADAECPTVEVDAGPTGGSDGSVGDADGGTGATETASDDDGGCGCVVAGAPRGGVGGVLGLAALALGLGWRRRRRGLMGKRRAP